MCHGPAQRNTSIYKEFFGDDARRVTRATHAARPCAAPPYRLGYIWLAPGPSSYVAGIDTDRTLRLTAEQAERLRQVANARRASLLVLDGTAADVGNQCSIGEEVLLGRDPAGFRLADGTCSKRHAWIRRKDDRYWIEDCRSTNGTSVNGEPVAGEVPLADGDTILIGRTVIRFQLIDDAEASYHERVQHLLGSDYLTGLAAKTRFDAALVEAIRAAAMGGPAVVVLMMDMDGLKAINDRHGHLVGATTIAQVGRCIGEVVAGRGVACRFGGDEFSAFLRGATLEDGVSMGESIRGAVAGRAFGTDTTQVRPTISIGVASWAPGDDHDATVARADAALYRAKAGGRNTVST